MLRLSRVRSSGLEFSLLHGGQGSPVFFLHGFGDSYESFLPQMQYLAQRGYEVFAPLLRGYEPSSQIEPPDYYISSLVEDFLEQLNNMQLDRVHLVGHDWGAIVTYAVAANWPDRLYSATALSVPYLKRMLDAVWKFPSQLAKSWYMFFFQLLGLSDYVFSQDNFSFLDRLYEAWSPAWPGKGAHLGKVKKIFSQPGVVNAALSYYRCFFDFFSAKGRESFRLITQKIEAPLMVIAGLNDGCVDHRLYDALFTREDFVYPPEIIKVPQAGHFVHLEKPEFVNRCLRLWFEKQEKSPS
ncbi:MAG: alpha/beta hydrolase [Leptospiraceae bacterium]|nr:alpha/beta hydrolase [Leptospiraceae bacterium]MDW8306438.1 alpha/beta hydrolase [Leptospiraceae bacterium]